MESDTDSLPKRLIYFRGHNKVRNSVLITKIYEDYTTLPTLDLECATRTLSNLYNLQTVRGSIINGELDLQSSMSGPHSYFGHIDPYSYYTLHFENNIPIFTNHFNINTFTTNKLKLEIPSHYLIRLDNYNWKIGIDLSKEDITKYNLGDVNIDDDTSLVDVTNQSSADSLFAYPGVLELEDDQLIISVIENPHKYNLSTFNVQLVKNNKPFSFNLDQIDAYKHAQHKLRLITYNYGPRYLKDYLLKHSGVFIERHEFIQLITPTNEQCSGYVLLGRINDRVLELIAIKIPYGYSLLVQPFAIHGDSGLIGTYLMAMTGNHVAMGTADTVYIKNKHTSKSVSLYEYAQLYFAEGENVNDKVEGDELLLTSSNMSLKKLRNINNRLIDDIRDVNNIFHRPIIYAPSTFGWTKTIGTKLPDI